MSVYKSKRSTSAIQYVENARQLQVFTIKNCVKFPKRYTYIVVQKIANLGEDIDTHVRVAESMMPTNLHEAQLKRDELTYTFGLLNSLDDKFQLVYDIVSDNPNFKMEFKWLPNAMLEWGRLIQKERDLITGVKKKGSGTQDIGDVGFGLGSQVSQIDALMVASPLDHFIKEQLHIKYYGRYMDDFYLIHENREYLKYCMEEIRKKCKEYGFVLNEKKTKMALLRKGVKFLKTKFFPE